jgi:hypothetical protein
MDDIIKDDIFLSDATKLGWSDNIYFYLYFRFLISIDSKFYYDAIVLTYVCKSCINYQWLPISFFYSSFIYDNFILHLLWWRTLELLCSNYHHKNVEILKFHLSLKVQYSIA